MMELTGNTPNILNFRGLGHKTSLKKRQRKVDNGQLQSIGAHCHMTRQENIIIIKGTHLMSRKILAIRGTHQMKRIVITIRGTHLVKKIVIAIRGTHLMKRIVIAIRGTHQMKRIIDIIKGTHLTKRNREETSAVENGNQKTLKLTRCLMELTKL
jgi:hypothetical protein